MCSSQNPFRNETKGWLPTFSPSDFLSIKIQVSCPIYRISTHIPFLSFLELSLKLFPCFQPKLISKLLLQTSRKSIKQLDCIVQSFCPWHTTQQWDLKMDLRAAAMIKGLFLASLYFPVRLRASAWPVPCVTPSCAAAAQCKKMRSQNQWKYFLTEKNPWKIIFKQNCIFRSNFLSL